MKLFPKWNNIFNCCKEAVTKIRSPEYLARMGQWDFSLENQYESAVAKLKCIEEFYTFKTF